jgi:hypothetical protein
MMWVDRITPEHGWPGSIVTISGGGFAEGLDDNRVEIGGNDALVLRATSSQLMVLVGEKATDGPVIVETANIVRTAAQSFRLLPPPEDRSVSEAGPPEFFHGPQHGTPALRVQSQRVVAIMTHPRDVPVPTAADHAAEVASFQDAERFWNEASYGRTTLDIATTGWLELPGDWRTYIWDQGDVEWARHRLFEGAKRWSHISGNRAYVAQGGLGLSLVDLTDRNGPFETSRISIGKRAFHVVTRGTLAYVGAEDPGLVIVDVGNSSAPVVRGSVAGIAPLWSIDLDPAGSILAGASAWNGLRLFDLTNPLSPSLLSTTATPGGWATCVKVVGTFAFVGAGNSVHVFDISTPSAPVLVDTRDAASWVMAIDATATMCVAATDGNGLAVFSVSGTGMIAAAGTERSVLRLHGVRMTGTTACCAGADRGIHFVDLTTPAAPAAFATLPTQAPCHDAAPDGTWALTSTGPGGVTPVWFANPRDPRLGPNVYLPTWVSDGISLDTHRTNLKVAQDSQSLLKSEQLYVDALRTATAAGNDVSTPVGIIVVIAGKFGRGQSSLKTKVGIPGNEWTFPDTKGVIWLGRSSTWGRKAHEIGHWFGMGDIYAEAFANGTAFRGTAGPWCMSGVTDTGSMFSAREAIRMRLFESGNAIQREWNPGGGPTTEEFEMVAHGLADDGGPFINLLELKVAAGLSYHVEVRQGPGAAIFDANLPEVRVDNGLLVVTRSRESTTPSNTFERPIELFGLAGPGESVVDAARLLRIEVVEKLNAHPLAFRVRVHWNEEPPPDPNGRFDLTITPWSEQTWETPDIWVNSPRNDTTDAAGAPVLQYAFHEAGDPARPVLSGDKPWVGRLNTIFARIHNTGVQDVHDVYVTSYVTSPPGIGDNGNWTTLESKRIPQILANDEAIVDFSWVPEADKHTCITIAIMPKAGEIEPRNNRSQENVAQFDSAGSSSHEPAMLYAEVRSPFSVWKKIDLEVRDLPDGWHAVVDHAWVWVPPYGSVPVTATIWTDLHSPRSERREIEREAFPRIDGWTDFDDHQYITIGGILAPVRANQRMRIGHEWSTDPGSISVYGWINPKFSGIPAVLEITDAVGAKSLVPMGSTDDDGRIFVTAQTRSGTYDLQIFSASTPDAAEAESDRWSVDVP